MTADWAPGADARTLEQRGLLLRNIREFFFERDVLEVTTPVLGATGASDVHIESLALQCDGGSGFLQTSPEYFMKRLLAACGRAIFQMGPVFRGHESGGRHNVEFTMLEWYRPGYGLPDLIDEVAALMEVSFAAFDCVVEPFRRCRYKDLFVERWGENPHRADLATLRRLAEPLEPWHISEHGDMGTRNDYLDLLFSRGVEARLEGPVIICEYPASQAALACTGEDAEGDPVSFRFEFVWRGVELANGYLELRDAGELRRRMGENNRLRRTRDLPLIEPDEKLLSALPQMPACAGVALGVDRLLMLLTGRQSLDEVMAFSDRRL